MAKTVIEELIVKIKQQGFVKTQKSVEALSDSLEDAAAGGELLNEVLDQTPNYIDQITNSYKEMAKASKQVNAGFDADGMVAELREMNGFLQRTVDELDHLKEISDTGFNDLIKQSSMSADTLDDLAASSERAEDRLHDVAKASTKAGASLEKTGKQSEKASRGLANNTRQGRNQARTFGDIAKVAGPLPLIYAQVAANVFALSEAFRVLNEASSESRLIELSSKLGSGIGQPINVLAKQLQEVTGYAVDFRTALKAASSGAGFGFTVEQMTKLTEVAQRASIVYGVELTDALNRVTRGISKQEIELLDELGLTVRLNEAFRDYANEHNLAADSLSAFQRQQAMYNAVVTQSAQRTRALGDSVAEQATGWEQLSVAILDSTREGLRFVADVLEPVAKFLADWVTEDRIGGPFSDIAENANRSSEAFAGITNEYDKLQARLNMQQDVSKIDAQIAHIQKRLTELTESALAGDLAFGDRDVESLRYELEQEYTKLVDARNSTMKVLRSAGGMVSNQDVQAYAAINNVVKQGVIEFNNMSSSILSTADPMANLVNNINAAEQALNNMAITNSDAQKILQGYGVSTREEFDSLAKSIRNYSSALRQSATDSVALAQIQASSDSRSQGKIKAMEAEVKLLERTIAYNGQLAQKLGQSSAIITAGDRQRKIMLEQQIRDAKVQERIKEAERNSLEHSLFLQENITDTEKLAAAQAKEGIRLEQEKLDIYSSQVGFKDEQIEAEIALRQAKLNSLEVDRQALDLIHERQRAADDRIFGMYGSQATGITGMDERESQDVMLDQAANNVSEAFSSLTGNIDGLDAMINGVGTLTAAMVTLGQTSMDSTQMATVGLQAFGGMLAMTSQAAITEIDHQIAMEQKRDGESEESLAKIQALEEKKIKEQKKAAQQQILVSTAVGVANALATGGPFPMNLVSAGLVAAAGMMAYQQASNAASNSLSQLAASSESDTGTDSIDYGERDATYDVSKSATAGEHAYSYGASGTGTAQSFTPRANGGLGTPGNSIVAGEHGAEVITPVEPVRVYNASQMASSSKSDSSSLTVNISTMDETNFRDFVMQNASAVESAVRSEYEQQGISIG